MSINTTQNYINRKTGERAKVIVVDNNDVVLRGETGDILTSKASFFDKEWNVAELSAKFIHSVFFNFDSVQYKMLPKEFNILACCVEENQIKISVLVDASSVQTEKRKFYVLTEAVHFRDKGRVTQYIGSCSSNNNLQFHIFMDIGEIDRNTLYPISVLT